MLEAVKNWAGKKLKKQVTSKNFYSYDDIPLKLYIQIAQSGNVLLLAKRKVFVTLQTFIELWEEIIKRSSEENGDFTYDYYHDLEESYGGLLSDYLALRATIAKLFIRNDPADIEFLREQGYPMKKFTNDGEYLEALTMVSHKVESLVTRILMNRSEKREVANTEQVVEKVPTLDDYIASISVDLPFELKDDVTLSRYNKYKKWVEEKRRPKPVEDGRD